MQKKSTGPAVIACSLDKADLADRQTRWLRLGKRARAKAVTTENGLRLLFRAAPGVEGELRQLAESERDCCAFADWSVHTHGEDVVLHVTADSEEGITAVQAMFNTLRFSLARATASPSGARSAVHRGHQ